MALAASSQQPETTVCTKSTCASHTSTGLQIIAAPRMSSFHAKAHNAVVARLLSCLVNEHLAQAHVVDFSALPLNLVAAADNVEGAASDFCHWLCISNPAHEGADAQVVRHNMFWVPLRHMPLLSPGKDKAVKEAAVANGGPAAARRPSRRVGLLDPEDLGLPVIQATPDEKVVNVVVGARAIMEQLACWHPSVADKATLLEQITQEMESSAMHQEAAYIRSNKASAPLELSIASAVQWEQSVVEGHATHPMHKSRFAVPPILPICPNKDLRFPTIHFFAVSRSLMTIRGPFEQLVSPLLSGCNDAIDWPSETVVPVHELQLPNIYEKFPQARQLSLTISAYAQVSLRTVVVEALPHLNLKLAIGMKVSSCMRTISPWSTYIGPSFPPIAERVIEDEALLQFCNELASVVVAHPDPDYAKHFSCIIRQDAQSMAQLRGEHVIVCAALTEKASAEEGEFVVNSVLSLRYQKQRSRFFRHYARRFLQAFTPPLYKYGVAFEAHLQNVLARFRRKSDADEEAPDGCPGWELVGFTVRDLGGIKVHQPTLWRATGGALQVEVWNEEASVLAKDLKGVHNIAFHTMVNCHLHRMARALGVHYDGSGWEAVRLELHALLPVDCLTRRLWLHKPTIPCKAFITMKLQELYRDYLYTEVPNLILCRPLSVANEDVIC